MKKILLAEDDGLLNKTLTYSLISEGYDTVSALNADTAARRSCKWSCPSLCCLAWRQSGQSGWCAGRKSNPW